MDERYNDIKLYFEEKEHKYKDTLNNNYTSVTTLLHKYTNGFNKKYWLHKKALEYGISEAALSKQWDDITTESCDRGNLRHNYLEDNIREVSKFYKAIQYLNKIEDGRMTTVADIPFLNVQPLNIDKFIEATDNKYPEIYRVFKYYTDKGYIIYSEIGGFLIDFLISGTIDILCYRPDSFIVLDWKTNKDGVNFSSGYYKKDKSKKPHQITNEWVNKDDRLKAPLSHMQECKGSIYSLQLSMYATMVSMILGIPCNGLGLCHIGSQFVLNEYGMPYRDDKGLYTIDTTKEETVKWFKIPYYYNEIIAIMNDHKMNINATINSQYKLEL